MGNQQSQTESYHMNAKNMVDIHYINQAKDMNAICILKSDTVNGYVSFHQCNIYERVRVKIQLKGPPGQTHAIHIHEYGDMRKGCDSLGAHYNPYETTHGSMLYEMPRHAGDLINNVTFDQRGHFYYEYDDRLINLFPSASIDNILGRSIVIHEKEDDLGRGKGAQREESLKTGNAGKRICCGIIGLCQAS
jgi:Cu-Zn family superoxide dismutase